MSALRDLRRVLIVGGGIGGMSAAIILARNGIVPDLIDIDPEWRVSGAGISISSPTFRAFAQLGLLDEMLAEGFVSRGLRLCHADGTVFADLPAEPGRGSGGVMRPVLHRLLSDRVKAAGTRVRLGVSVIGLDQSAREVDVTFSDGTLGRYDFVVAADGIYSGVRRMIFPDAPVPQYTGQGCWRVMTEKPAELDFGCIYYAGIKAGMTPLSATEMYLYTLQERPLDPRPEPSDYVRMLTEHLKPFGGYVAAVRDRLDPNSNIMYRPLEKLLLPSPWFAGRVLLIGDAAHATTPHLASGAGIAVEDACVLGEELAKADTLEDALSAFMARRFERCRTVVESSVRIGELEMAGGSDDEQFALIMKSMAELAVPM